MNKEVRKIEKKFHKIAKKIKNFELKDEIINFCYPVFLGLRETGVYYIEFHSITDNGIIAEFDYEKESDYNKEVATIKELYTEFHKHILMILEEKPDLSDYYYAGDENDPNL